MKKQFLGEFFNVECFRKVVIINFIILTNIISSAKEITEPTILLLNGIQDPLGQSMLSGTMIDDWQCRALYILNGKYHFYLFSNQASKGEWYDSTREFNGRSLIGFDLTSNQLIFRSKDGVERIAMAANAKLSDYFVTNSVSSPVSTETVVKEENPMRRPPRRFRTMEEQFANKQPETFTMLLHNRMQKGFIPVQVSLSNTKPLTDGSAIAYPVGALSTFTPEMIRSMDKDQLEGFMAEYEGIRNVPATPESLDVLRNQAEKVPKVSQNQSHQP